MGSDTFLLAYFLQTHEWGPQGPTPGRHRGDKLGEEQREAYREAVSMWEVVERKILTGSLCSPGALQRDPPLKK